MIKHILLEEIIRAHPRQDATLSDERVRAYGLIQLSPVRSGDGHGFIESPICVDGMEYNPYLDTPLAIALTHNRHPQALAGIQHRGDVLMIEQLQGLRPLAKDEMGRERKGHSRGLAPIDWEAVLVESVAAYARLNKIPEIGIQQGDQNRWYKSVDCNGDPRLPLDKAQQRYDRTAERLGFQLGRRGLLPLPLIAKPAYYRKA